MEARASAVPCVHWTERRARWNPTQDPDGPMKSQRLVGNQPGLQADCISMICIVLLLSSHFSVVICPCSSAASITRTYTLAFDPDPASLPHLEDKGLQ